MTAAVFVDDFDGVVVRRLVAVISGLSEARPPVGDAIVFSADRIVLVWAQTSRAIGRAEEKPRGKIFFFFENVSSSKSAPELIFAFSLSWGRRNTSYFFSLDTHEGLLFPSSSFLLSS